MFKFKFWWIFFYLNHTEAKGHEALRNQDNIHWESYESFSLVSLNNTVRTMDSPET